MYLNEYVKAVAYFEVQHVMEISVKLAHVQSDAALNMGVDLTLHVRAARQDQVPRFPCVLPSPARSPTS